MIANAINEILAALRADVRRVPPELRWQPDVTRLVDSVNFHAMTLGILAAQLAREEAEDYEAALREVARDVEREAAIAAGAVVVLPRRAA